MGEIWNYHPVLPGGGGESKMRTAALLRHYAGQGGLRFGAAGEEDDITDVTHKTFEEKKTLKEIEKSGKHV